MTSAVRAGPAMVTKAAKNIAMVLLRMNLPPENAVMHENQARDSIAIR
jgi:hypothetical protein